MRAPKRAHRTRYGEGSFKYNEKRGLWIGRFDTGTLNSRGNRIVITASAKDEQTAWNRFIAAKKDFLINGPKLETIKRNQTVKGWADEWLPRHSATTVASNWKTDRANLKNWIIPQIGKVRLEDLTAAHMRKVGEAPKKAGRKASTAHSAQRTLTKMLNAAIQDGYKVPKRVLAAKKVSLGETDRAAMTVDQAKQVFAKAREMFPDHIRFLMAVLYGARKSELLGLTWDKITYYPDLPEGAPIVGEIDISQQLQAVPYKDRGAGTFHIPEDREAVHLVDSWHLVQPKTKAGERALPLLAPIAKDLEAWRAECPTGEGNPHNLVFPRIRGKKEFLGYPRNKETDLKEWQQIQAAAEVWKRPGDPPTYYLLHEARHATITMLADAGTPKHLIEMLVGQTELVRGYVHGSLDSVGSAVSAAMSPLLGAS